MSGTFLRSLQNQQMVTQTWIKSARGGGRVADVPKVLH